MTARATRSALQAVRAAPTLLEAMHRGPLLDSAVTADCAASPAGANAVAALLQSAVEEPSDQLVAAIATLALGSVCSESSVRTLVRLLDGGAPYLVQHAICALGRGPFVEVALVGLTRFVSGGDFNGMLAQRTLQLWAEEHPDAVGGAVERQLNIEGEPAGRAMLVETLGVAPGRARNQRLREIAADDSEAVAARAAAVAALGDRVFSERWPNGPTRSTPRIAPVDDVVKDTEATRRVLVAVASGAEPLAAVAVTALRDLDVRPATGERDRRNRGRTVAQLFLHADVDGDLSQAGRGDTGGIATLLVQLGDALLQAEPAVDRVLTMSRGRPAHGLGDLASIDEPGHHYLSIPLWGPNRTAAQAWPLRIQIARGLRRLLRAAGGVDVLHLRMGDVATMVAAEVAGEMDIPVVFTLAPDPNALVSSRDAEGVLTRAEFGAADAVEHLVFRERLLRTLQEESAHLVLFPRPALGRDMRALMNLDIEAEVDRVSVIAEGVSMAAIDAADTTDDVGGSVTSSARAELDDLLSQLPVERRNLPLAISVGRLSPVKGMVTLVQVWFAQADLRDRCNLLIVGGDLASPNGDEQQQLSAFDAVLPLPEASSQGLLLPGNRSNATVAAWLRAVRVGRPGGAAPGGVYVSASLKEEFGIAILEALATGLVVVAPNTGGPATYVHDGVTGILADTASRVGLGAAIGSALDLAVAPDADGRAEQAADMVRERFGIDTMAASLAQVYRGVAADAAARADVAGAAL
ncbi:MAG: glycosyltransferase family 4 protein [Allobranchiibius sp.]